MIRRIAFLLFLLALAGALGMLLLEKVRHNRAVDRCHADGGTWNYMEQDCDRYH